VTPFSGVITHYYYIVVVVAVGRGARRRTTSRGAWENAGGPVGRDLFDSFFVFCFLFFFLYPPESSSPNIGVFIWFRTERALRRPVRALLSGSPNRVSSFSVPRIRHVFH